MSTKQCEEKLKDKGVRPTAARILILQKLSEQTHPISLLELEAQLETLDKSTISRSLAILLEHHAVHAFEDGSGSMKSAEATRRPALSGTDTFIFIAKFVIRPIAWII